MEKIKADKLRKGDLIYMDDAYHEVVSDERYKGLTNSYPHVHIKSFMSPSTHSNISSSYINIKEEVLLLVRGTELLDEGSNS